MKEYDMSVLCNPEKASVVEDVLSWTSMGILPHVADGTKELVVYVHRFS